MNLLLSKYTLGLISFVVFHAMALSVAQAACSNSYSGSCWDHENRDGNDRTVLRLSNESALSVRNWLESRGYHEGTAEIATLTEIIELNRSEPLLLYINKSADLGEDADDCGLYDIEQNYVGDMISSSWLESKTCEDVKHFIGLHLNHLIGAQELASKLGMRLEEISPQYLEKSAAFTTTVIASEVLANRFRPRDWVEFASVAKKLGFEINGLTEPAQELRRVVGETSGFLIIRQAGEFDIVAAITPSGQNVGLMSVTATGVDNYILVENPKFSETRRSLTHSDWSKMLETGDITFVRPYGDLIDTPKSGSHIPVAFEGLKRFVEYSNISIHALVEEYESLR